MLAFWFGESFGSALMIAMQALVLPGAETQAPLGGIYEFFRIEGQDDSLTLAKRLVTEAGLGLAPGAAFSDEGEGGLRRCFAARDPQRLTSGVQRPAAALGL